MHSPRVPVPPPLCVPSPSPCPCRSGASAPCVSPRPSQQMSTVQNLRKSLVRNWRPVCSVVGAAVLRPSLPLSPPSCFLPPAGLGQSAACELFWTYSDPLFCEWPAVCLGWLIFSISVAFSQFKLVTHKSSLRLPSGHSGPVLTPNNTLPLSIPPPLAGGGCGRLGFFSAGSCF